MCANQEIARCKFAAAVHEPLPPSYHIGAYHGQVRGAALGCWEIRYRYKRAPAERRCPYKRLNKKALFASANKAPLLDQRIVNR